MHRCGPTLPRPEHRDNRDVRQRRGSAGPHPAAASPKHRVTRPVTGSLQSSSIAAPLRQTFTYDQGKEMSRHQELTAATGVKVYFCDPHSPWQRGTCENTNGLLRQYLPKGTDLSVYSQEDLDAIADSLNSRPRATHAFHLPFEVFASMLALASGSFFN